MHTRQLVVGRLFGEIGVGPEAFERAERGRVLEHAIGNRGIGRGSPGLVRVAHPFRMVSCIVSSRNRPMSSRRAIPSIERLLDRPALVAAAGRHGRSTVVAAARRAAEAWREHLALAETDDATTADDVARWLEDRIAADLDARTTPSLTPVINATGVVIHTNLGRAPLATEAIAHVARLAAGYTNLEYDLEAGTRGQRHVHAERLLCQLTGAEAALVVNNNAAAALVALAALAAGREVIVSRGELVEIGGGFRVPDVLAQSGAVLREVGTTNRTRTADYAAAIGDRTGALLRVHPSNFRISGFTQRPSAADLADLAHRFQLPLIEDLGSGWLGLDPPPAGLADEPSVTDSLRAGADVVTFSGDKLLGGPQAGILVGRRDLDRDHRPPSADAGRARRQARVRRTRSDARAVGARAGSNVHSGDGHAVGRPQRRRGPRAAAGPGVVTRRVAALPPRDSGASTPGGGSAPDAVVPTVLVTIDAEHASAARLHERLRRASPPVVARIEDDRLILDLRTVRDGEVETLAASIAWAVDLSARRRP